MQLAWAVNEKERSFIIKPEGWEIPEASIEVHGITAERANAEGVPFADIIDEFLEDCKKPVCWSDITFTLIRQL